MPPSSIAMTIIEGEISVQERAFMHSDKSHCLQLQHWSQVRSAEVILLLLTDKLGHSSMSCMHNRNKCGSSSPRHQPGKSRPGQGLQDVSVPLFRPWCKQLVGSQINGTIENST